MDLDFHATVWGDELKAFTLEQGEKIGTLYARRIWVSVPKKIVAPKMR